MTEIHQIKSNINLPYIINMFALNENTFEKEKTTIKKKNSHK